MNLDDRLRALATDTPGDWADVRRRAGSADARRRRTRLALVFAALALVVAGTAVGARVLDLFSFSEDPREVPLRPAEVGWVAGDVLNVPGQERQRLERPLLAPLLGYEPPLAVTSPDGSRVVYHAWEDRVPLLVERDLRSRDERVLARGAQTFAWSADGRRAWFQADHERFGENGDPFVGHVVVDGETWTQEKGPYEVLAWAGERLLVKVRRCLICSDTLEPGVYALDRAGPLVRLPLDDVAALSPDGRRAVGPYLPVAGQDSPSGLIRLVDVQAGRVLHTFDLRRIGRSPTPVSGRGAWRGNELVLPMSVGFRRLLVFFRAGDRLAVDGSIRVPRGTLPVRFAVTLYSPQFVGSGTRRVVAGISGERIGGGYASAVLTCDRDARSCVRGRLVPPRRWFAVLANPSRP